MIRLLTRKDSIKERSGNTEVHDLESKLVVVTDLDGTLLDHSTYSFAPALPALKRLKQEAVPIVFCSSKTSPEIRRIQQEIGVEDPFIFENGGGIWLPARLRGSETEMAIGLPRSELADHLKEIARRHRFEFRSMLEMSDGELADETGLTLEDARLARKRVFSIPFLISSSGIDIKALQDEARSRGLRLTAGGRFFHLMGPYDKGYATRKLRDIYTGYWGSPIKMIGLGDSRNDLEMLREVDVAICIPNPQSRVPLTDEVAWSLVADAPGPRGWNEAIIQVLGNT